MVLIDIVSLTKKSNDVSDRTRQERTVLHSMDGLHFAQQARQQVCLALLLGSMKLTLASLAVCRIGFHLAGHAHYLIPEVLQKEHPSSRLGELIKYIQAMGKIERL